MAVPVTTLTRQSLVDMLKNLRKKYELEEEQLRGILDNVHHAYGMKEWGEHKQLKETIAELKTIILKYDETTKTLTFHLNGCTGDVPVMDPQVPESEVVLPSKGAMDPPVGQKLYGWNTKADGTGDSYKFSAKFIMPNANIILYALLGPDPNYVEEED